MTKLRGCGVYVFSDDGTRLLLTQRGPESRHQQYKWEGPGGQCEAGESYEVAARREFREELGIAVELGEVLGEFEEIIDSNGTSWEAKIFRGSITETPVIQEPTKCVGFGWFTQAEIKQLNLANYLADYIVKDLEAIGWL